MVTKLSEMTLDELWQLFPIILTEHNAEWTTQYEMMAGVLKEKFASRKIFRISHIGYI